MSKPKLIKSCRAEEEEEDKRYVNKIRRWAFVVDVKELSMISTETLREIKGNMSHNIP